MRVGELSIDWLRKSSRLLGSMKVRFQLLTHSRSTMKTALTRASSSRTRRLLTRSKSLRTLAEPFALAFLIFMISILWAGLCRAISRLSMESRKIYLRTIRSLFQRRKRKRRKIYLLLVKVQGRLHLCRDSLAGKTCRQWPLEALLDLERTQLKEHLEYQTQGLACLAACQDRGTPRISWRQAVESCSQKVETSLSRIKRLICRRRSRRRRQSQVCIRIQTQIRVDSYRPEISKSWPTCTLW